VLAGAVALAAVLAGAAVAASFTDPAGDVVVAPEGADVTGLALPDITSVDVTNSPDGLVTFRIVVATPTLSPLSVLGVVLDLDKSPLTGDDGVEAIIGYLVDPLGQGGLLFDRWDGGELVEVAASTATTSFSEGVLTITVPRSELLDTRGFGFGVAALAFTANLAALAVDVAPDSEELWVYDLVGIPPPPPPGLSATRPVGSPARPAAGKTFVVTSLVTRADTGDIVTAGSVRCAVKVGKASIRATGRFRNLAAHCTMKVPAKASLKTLKGTMTIRSAGGVVARPFSFRVR
jgi:hypothetical protein